MFIFMYNGKDDLGNFIAAQAHATVKHFPTVFFFFNIDNLLTCDKPQKLTFHSLFYFAKEKGSGYYISRQKEDQISLESVD